MRIKSNFLIYLNRINLVPPTFWSISYASLYSLYFSLRVYSKHMLHYIACHPQGRLQNTHGTVSRPSFATLLPFLPFLHQYKNLTFTFLSYSRSKEDLPQFCLFWKPSLFRTPRKWRKMLPQFGLYRKSLTFLFSTPREVRTATPIWSFLKDFNVSLFFLHLEE